MKTRFLPLLALLLMASAALALYDPMLNSGQQVRVNQVPGGLSPSQSLSQSRFFVSDATSDNNAQLEAGKAYIMWLGYATQGACAGTYPNGWSVRVINAAVTRLPFVYQAGNVIPNPNADPTQNSVVALLTGVRNDSANVAASVYFVPATTDSYHLDVRCSVTLNNVGWPRWDQSAGFPATLEGGGVFKSVQNPADTMGAWVALWNATYVPTLMGAEQDGIARLTWTTDPTCYQYKFYKGSASGEETFTGRFTGQGEGSINDRSPPDSTRYYQVTCVTATGESARSNEVTLSFFDIDPLSGPTGTIYGGNQAASAAGLGIPVDALPVLYGIIFVVGMGLAGASRAPEGYQGIAGLGGAVLGIGVAIALSFFPTWFLMLVGTALVVALMILGFHGLFSRGDAE